MQQQSDYGRNILKTCFSHVWRVRWENSHSWSLELLEAPRHVTLSLCVCPHGLQHSSTWLAGHLTEWLQAPKAPVLSERRARRKLYCHLSPSLRSHMVALPPCFCSQDKHTDPPHPGSRGGDRDSGS